LGALYRFLNSTEINLRRMRIPKQNIGRTEVLNTTTVNLPTNRPLRTVSAFLRTVAETLIELTGTTFSMAKPATPLCSAGRAMIGWSSRTQVNFSEAEGSKAAPVSTCWKSSLGGG
jgi:hypothetical protein